VEEEAGSKLLCQRSERIVTNKMGGNCFQIFAFAVVFPILSRKAKVDRLYCRGKYECRKSKLTKLRFCFCFGAAPSPGFEGAESENCFYVACGLGKEKKERKKKRKYALEC
jgi:hypothetical protein